MNNEDYLAKVLPQLRAPMPFKWKVQTGKANEKGQCVAYVDSRDVVERLDKVLTLGWSDSHFLLNGITYDAITINLPVGTLTRTDCGDSDNPTEKDKTAASDSFKRAAVKFGVGAFLYDNEKVWIQLNDKKQPVKKDGSRIYDLTEYINKELGKGAKLTDEETPAPPVEKKSTKIKEEKDGEETAPPKEETKPTPTSTAGKKEWLKPDHEKWAYCVGRLKANVKIEAIQKHFNISAENLEALKKAAGIK